MIMLELMKSTYYIGKKGLEIVSLPDVQEYKDEVTAICKLCEMPLLKIFLSADRWIWLHFLQRLTLYIVDQTELGHWKQPLFISSTLQCETFKSMEQYTRQAPSPWEGYPASELQLQMGR